MATIKPDYKIAVGHNNAAGLTLVTSLTDSNGVTFLMPRGLPYRSRGEKRPTLLQTIKRAGQNSTRWVSSGMTLAQYKKIIDTYEGLVTIRIALSTTTFANYNATLYMPDESELEYVYLKGHVLISGFTGPGYINVPWYFNGLEAL